MKEKERAGPKPDGLWTVQDVADYLQLSKETLYKYVEDKKIPYLHIGGVYRFRKSEVDAWVDKQKGGGK